jgi:hypothetical protein
MVIALWLQHCYFEGAKKTIQFCLHDFFVLIKERKRKNKKTVEIKDNNDNENNDEKTSNVKQQQNDYILNIENNNGIIMAEGDKKELYEKEKITHDNEENLNLNKKNKSPKKKSKNNNVVKID